jgi:2-succinyl-6-hydroxy-2,4-cyclohexadiene-1-carboxylate synthase
VSPTHHLTFAHGFTQTRRSWDHIVDLLGERGVDGADVIAVDLPGHGGASELRTDLWGAADHLVRAGGTGTYIGYSMGGRVALHAALAHRESVEQLVLIGATPGIVDDAERQARRVADDALAAHLEEVGVATFIDEWLAKPLFAGLSPARAQRDDRLRNTASGLASSLRMAGTGTQTPLWDRLSDITCPVLLIVGADDTKFRAIADRMVELLPDASLATIDGSGHTAHLEQPAATVAALATWLC